MSCEFFIFLILFNKEVERKICIMNFIKYKKKLRFELRLYLFICYWVKKEMKCGFIVI